MTAERPRRTLPDLEAPRIYQPLKKEQFGAVLEVVSES